MNERFPVLSLRQPEVLDRRRLKPHSPALAPELIAKRREIADNLKRQIAPVTHKLRQMTPEQRRNFFVTLEHEGPVSLVGTDLKALSQVDDRVTLAVCREDSLDRLESKIEDFATVPERKGHLKNEQLAIRLETIQPGKPTDRLSEDLFDKYDEYIVRDWVIIEAEITTLETGVNKRRKAIQRILQELDDLLGHGIGGNIFEHEEQDDVCRMVMRCTGPMLRTLVEAEHWQTRIAYFDVQPTFQTYHQILQEFSIGSLGELTAPNEDEIVVGVIDSGVVPGNPFLAPVVKVGALRCFLADRTKDVYDEHGHGSGVASLAAYYALNLATGAANRGRLWIASARVLDENNRCEERLFSKAIEDAVQEYVRLGIRIFNLSVNVSGKPWNVSMKRLHPKHSWIARAIDRLTRQLDVTFVASVGNLSEADINWLEQISPYPRYFTKDDCKILDPGQAALALSVGSVALSTEVVGRAGQFTAVALPNQPSPFTRAGPGIRREIKPEVVDYGGNLVRDHQLGIVRTNLGTSIPVAAKIVTPPFIHDHGTSLAAPRVTHKLGRILSDLQSFGILDPASPLVRAMAVNSCTFPWQTAEVQTIVRELDQIEKQSSQHVYGYGMIDADSAMYCDDFSVVMIYQGSLEIDKVAYFDFPVPASLAASPNRDKIITITVAYNPEVHKRGFVDYFGTLLKWRLFRGDVPIEDVVTAMSIEDGPSPSNFELQCLQGVNRRSRGSIQHDTFVWKDHDKTYSQHDYTLAITSFEKWHRAHPDPVPYAVVVRIEETSQTVKIYNEIEVSLRSRVQVHIARR